jgi:hypothetical protein
VNGVAPGVLVERPIQFIRLVEACRRYGNPGASSAGKFSTASSAQAWFSLDGTTQLARERNDLASATWRNSAGGTNNPATITNTTAIKFFRLFHP